MFCFLHLLEEIIFFYIWIFPCFYDFIYSFTHFLSLIVHYLIISIDLLILILSYSLPWFSTFSTVKRRTALIHSSFSFFIFSTFNITHTHPYRLNTTLTHTHILYIHTTNNIYLSYLPHYFSYFHFIFYFLFPVKRRTALIPSPTQ